MQAGLPRECGRELHQHSLRGIKSRRAGKRFCPPIGVYRWSRIPRDGSAALRRARDRRGDPPRGWRICPLSGRFSIRLSGHRGGARAGLPRECGRELHQHSLRGIQSRRAGKRSCPPIGVYRWIRLPRARVPGASGHRDGSAALRRARDHRGDPP